MSIDRTPRLIVVELFDDARITAAEAAKEIVANMEDVRLAYAAYEDGFGRIVQDSPAVQA